MTFTVVLYVTIPMQAPEQCDQKKIAKCLQKLPKNDFNRKMIDFKTLYKNCQRMWEIWTC